MRSSSSSRPSRRTAASTGSRRSPGCPTTAAPATTAATVDPDPTRHHGDDRTSDDEFGHRSRRSTVRSCYGEADAEAAAECFADLVSRGEIDQTEVPWWLQHIECGATDANWDVEYYTLPDDEFVALIDEAAPCYQALVGQR